MICPQCGAPLEQNALKCKYCGEPIQQQPVQQQVQPVQQVQQAAPQPVQQQRPAVNISPDGINQAWPIKSKVTAGILAIFLGAFGIHKFYLGNTGAGVLYLIFCWTYIPAIIGFIEGIIYLCSNDHNFQVKNHVRLK